MIRVKSAQKRFGFWDYVSILCVYLVLGFFLFSGCASKSAVLNTSQSTAAKSHSASNLSSPNPAQSVAKDEELEEDFLDEDEDELNLLDEESEEPTLQIADPLAALNRFWFDFNDKLYFWLLKPVAKGYRAVMPTPVRIGFQNFFKNLTAPIRIVNCLLQGKGRSGADEFARFIINTGPGLFGFLDATQNIPDLKSADEDLGQTLAVYGIGDGFYIVWPFLGPSTLRDTIGGLGDRFLNPLTYVQPLEAALGLTALRGINATSFRIGDYEALKDAALEPYDAFQNAYIQNRQKKIKE